MRNLILPELHDKQKEILKESKRFNVVCCGRRFGKDVLLEDVAIKYALQGKKVGITAPTFKMSSENSKSLLIKLQPVLKKKSGSENQIVLITGGTIDFWSLDNFESMRGRKYHCHITNEAARYRHLQNAWEEVIRPTLVDYKGSGWFFSTPRGLDYFNTLYMNAFKPDYMDRWKSFQYSSYDNPKLDRAELEDIVKDLPELVYRQEIMAEFVEGSGTLVKSSDIKYYSEAPEGCEVVVAVDLAISQKETADYTAIVTMFRHPPTGQIYIEDVVRERISFNKILEHIKSVYNKYKPSIIGIEQVSFQASVIQELLRTTNLPIKGIRADKDKTTRFQPILSRFEQGLVYIKNDITNEYKKELLAFPIGNHDDMVDATAHAFSLFLKPKQSFMF